MFHSPDGLTLKEKQDAATRRFIGDGTPYLRVPGLVRHTAVRVGGTPIPEEIPVEVPMDHTLTRVQAIRTPGTALIPDDFGQPVLYRSRFSNDGIWQAGVPIFVTGEWQPEAVGA